MSIRVTVWGEYRHEKQNPLVSELYPQGMHEAIGSYLRRCEGLAVHTAHLDEPEHGLSDERLKQTDVLTWWGHLAHDDLQDLIAERVYHRVHEGMGLIVLHSGHYSKIFKKLMGTTCNLKWREADDSEVLWVTRPGHPIVRGIDDHFVLPREEMYGEYFDIPEPQETVLISSFTAVRTPIYYRGREGLKKHFSEAILSLKSLEVDIAFWAETQNPDTLMIVEAVAVL